MRFIDGEGWFRSESIRLELAPGCLSVGFEAEAHSNKCGAKANDVVSKSVTKNDETKLLLKILLGLDHVHRFLAWETHREMTS